MLKSTQIILFFIISLIAISCTQKFELSDHYDPTLPFVVLDQSHPSGTLYETEIQTHQSKHIQLLSWLQSNTNNWKKTDHNTHAGLIIVSQGDFRILLYRDSDFAVIGYTDEDNKMQQYIIKDIDTNELLFLVND